jgi:3-phosphoshikimate 1-carboxyvinyltransferase
MNLMVRKTRALSGSATPPSSKSQNIRGLFFALLAQGRSTLRNALDAEDIRDAMQVCRSLGATITQHGADIIVDSPGLPLIATTTSPIFSGNSGVTTHFTLPLLGYRNNVSAPVLFDCGAQMRARGIQPLADALQNLGLSIQYQETAGFCPLSVSGRLQGGKTSVDGISSQYLSALLIALPCAAQDSEITVVDLHERPYVEMTFNWLQEQKIYYQHRRVDHQDIINISGNQRYQPFCKALTGDFSSAACLIAAGALLPGTIELQGMDMNDPQGDRRLIEILRTMGADITVDSSRLIIRGGRPLTGLCIDANDIPDLLPALAVIGTQASGKTVITHVRQARLKETDRIHSMTQGLKRLGARVEAQEDGMTIYPSRLTGCAVQGFADHRTVMALAVAGSLADGVTLIDDAEAVRKTFPQFIGIMQSLGAHFVEL